MGFTEYLYLLIICSIWVRAILSPWDENATLPCHNRKINESISARNEIYVIIQLKDDTRKWSINNEYMLKYKNEIKYSTCKVTHNSMYAHIISQSYICVSMHVCAHTYTHMEILRKNTYWYSKKFGGIHSRVDLLCNFFIWIIKLLQAHSLLCKSEKCILILRKQLKIDKYNNKKTHETKNYN